MFAESHLESAAARTLTFCLMFAMGVSLCGATGSIDATATWPGSSHHAAVAGPHSADGSRHVERDAHPGSSWRIERADPRQMGGMCASHHCCSLVQRPSRLHLTTLVGPGLATSHAGLIPQPPHRMEPAIRDPGDETTNPPAQVPLRL